MLFVLSPCDTGTFSSIIPSLETLTEMHFEQEEIKKPEIVRYRAKNLTKDEYFRLEFAGQTLSIGTNLGEEIAPAVRELIKTTGSRARWRRTVQLGYVEKGYEPF